MMAAGNSSRCSEPTESGVFEDATTTTTNSLTQSPEHHHQPPPQNTTPRGQAPIKSIVSQHPINCSATTPVDDVEFGDDDEYY